MVCEFSLELWELWEVKNVQSMSFGPHEQHPVTGFGQSDGDLVLLVLAAKDERAWMTGLLDSACLCWFLLFWGNTSQGMRRRVLAPNSR